MQRVCALAGVRERVSGPAGERIRTSSGRPCELERFKVVVGQLLGLVLTTTELLDPGCRGEVLRGAVGARDLPVGDVANEQVAERVLAVLDDRGRALAADELPAAEVVQSPLEITAPDAGEECERTGQIGGANR